MKKDKTIADLYEVMIERFDEVDKRFDEVDKRFDGFEASVNQRFDEARDERTKIMRDVSNIQRDIARLEERIEHFGGFAKEIDELRTRLANIENHLGITPALAV